MEISRDNRSFIEIVEVIESKTKNMSRKIKK